MQLIDNVYARCVPKPRPYFELLDQIHQYLLPRTYAEIGVATGRSMTLALPGTLCVGVDPNPKIIFGLPRGSRIFSQTSDEFFAEHDLRTLFGQLPLDLAFIDGMHHFEFALRDFIHVERASCPTTTILVHDCLPIDELTSARERTTSVWSGDIWRFILLLRRWRPDLETAVVDSAPTGLGLIRGLDPSSTVLRDHYQEIVDHYLSMPYRMLDDGSKEEQLNRVPGNWPTVKALLPDQPFRRTNLELLKTVRAVEAAGFSIRRRLRRSSPT